MRAINICKGLINQTPIQIESLREDPLRVDEAISQYSVGARHIVPLCLVLSIAFNMLLFSSSFASRDAYVINNLAETMSHIDLETGTVQNHVTTLGQTPNQIAYNDGYLYVVNSISADIQKIDPQSFLVAADMPLPIGSNPYSICFWADHAFVTGWISGVVYRINLSTNQIDGDLEIDGYPEGIIYANDHLFVAQTAFNPADFSYGQGQVAVIDASAMELETEINVGKDPQAFCSASDGTLHLVCTGNYVDVSGSIYIINSETEAVEDSILIGGQPANAAISSDGIAYLAAGGWVDHGFIYSYDITSKQILHGLSNPILVGIGVTGVAVDSLGFVYSCDFGGDEITKCDSSGYVLATYQVGDGPNSIVILDDALNGIHDDTPSLPKLAGLLACYPNPFNSQVAIKYRISTYNTNSRVVEIYNLSGQRIKSLPLETNREQGVVIWNGTDENRKGCASGVYFARLVDDSGQFANADHRKTLRLILIK